MTSNDQEEDDQNHLLWMLDQREEDYDHQPSAPSDHLQAPLIKRKKVKGSFNVKCSWFSSFSSWFDGANRQSTSLSSWFDSPLDPLLIC